LWSRFNTLLSFAVINVQFSGFLWAKILIIGLPIVVSTKRFHPYNCLENVSFAQTREDGLRSTIVLGFQVSMTH